VQAHASTLCAWPHEMNVEKKIYGHDAGSSNWTGGVILESTTLFLFIPLAEDAFTLRV